MTKQRKPRPLIAYCWANGRIDFGRRIPRGAIEIARGTDRVVRREISATARLAYDNKTLLVPGIPEAVSPTAAVDALGAHCEWLKGRESRRFKVNCKSAAASRA